MTGPHDPAAAGGDQFRAGYADRERVIEALKDAFVHGRLTKDELDLRVSQALASRTYAELAALTADIPAGLTTAKPARPPAPVRRRPLARAAAKSGVCLIIAAAATWVWALLVSGDGDYDGIPGANPPHESWAPLALLVVLLFVGTAIGILASAVATSREQRRSRRQLPPRLGPGGHALEAAQSSGTSNRPALPPDRPDQARADLRSDTSRPGRPHSSRRDARTQRVIRSAPGAV